MKALTLWPEWAWSIMHLGKDVENRTWHPPKNILGQRIALHAGRKVGRRYEPFVKGALPYYDFVVSMARDAGILPRYIRGKREGLDGEFIVGIQWYANGDVNIDGKLYKYGDVIKEMIFEEILLGAVFATARIESCTVYRKSEGWIRSPWAAEGQYTWKLNDLVIIEKPVQCQGKQALWTLSPEVEVEVRRQDKFDSRFGNRVSFCDKIS